LLQLLELYGCQQSVSSLTTLPVTIESLLNVSPDEDDATRPWHLQDQVGIMQDYHEFGERWPSQESVVRSLEIGYLKLYVFCAEFFSSLEGYGKGDLANEGYCCPRDYAMEGSLTGTRHGSRQPHLVKRLQEQNVQVAASIDEDSIKFDILDDGANYKMVPPRLWHKVWVITAVKGNGDLRPF
jgi:hypothetical protein